MPNPKRATNIALPAAEQERLDIINRQADLERMYKKYAPEAAVAPVEVAPSSAPAQSVPWYTRAIDTFLPKKAVSEDVAMPAYATQAWQLNKLKEEELAKRKTLTP